MKPVRRVGRHRVGPDRVRELKRGCVSGARLSLHCGHTGNLKVRERTGYCTLAQSHMHEMNISS